MCVFACPGNPSQDPPKPRVPQSAWPGSLIQSLLVHMFLLTCLLARARWLRRAFASSVSETDATLHVFSMCFQSFQNLFSLLLLCWGYLDGGCSNQVRWARGSRFCPRHFPILSCLGLMDFKGVLCEAFLCRFFCAQCVTQRENRTCRLLPSKLKKAARKTGSIG